MKNKPIKPIKQFRMGRIVASVFANEHDGRPKHNVSITRLYKGDDNQIGWSRSHSFVTDDLPRVEMLPRRAYAWVHEHRQGGV